MTHYMWDATCDMWHVVEGNIDFRLNVDDQQDDKTFKVKSDIDDSDDV